MNGIRTYEVEYLINAGGNAAGYFETLAKGTAGMVEPLKQMERNIGSLTSTLKSFKQDETLKNLFTIKPTIDTSTFQTQLKSMQEAVKVAAEKMSMELNKALASAASFKPIDLKKAVADSKKEMSARLTDLEKTWNKLAPGKDIRTVKRQGNLSKQAWAIRNDYKDVATQLGVWGAKASKAAQQVIDSTTTATQIAGKAAAIKKLNDSLKNFTAGKSYSVKINADISQAVSKINTLLTTVRESTAAIPVTLAGENKSAKGKSISKAGKVTKTGAKNVQAAVNNDIMSSLLKGQEKAATLKINADISPALEQLKALLDKISTSAAKIPVSLAAATQGKAKKGEATAAKDDLASKLLAGKKQSATLKIDADTAPALTKIAQLIEKVQGSTATMPVTLSAASKTGKTKGDGTKTNATAANSALTNIVKGKEQVLDIKAKFDGSQLVTQLTESIAKLQSTAKEKPVVIRGTFNGSDAGFQLNQSIANLQRLANSKPVVLSTTTSSAGAKANDGTIPPTTVVSTKESGGTKQTSGKSVAKGGTASTSIIATPAQERAAIQWENSIKKSQLENWASSLKQKYAEQSRYHQERQAMYERLWGKKPPMTITPKQIEAYQKWASTMSEQRLQRSLAYGDEVRSQSSAYRAQRQAMYERLWGPATVGNPKQGVVRAIDAANTEQLARVKAYNAATQAQTAAAPASMLATSSSTRGASFPRRATIKAPKVPDPWYQFTGNTSFGARTPMAVDMAKGMGAMFAIGGAMSAVGNSLHQAMSYQNTMRTTQAIFKHGKTPYSESDFVDMEQTARQIGKETKFTAPQVAQATKFLAMAGYNAKESKDAIKPIADIALIGDTDLGETADKLTNVMTAFGKNPKQMQDVADIMTTTFTRSNTDMMMLAESAKYAGGIANLYGGNFKNNFADVMAMFGIMGNAGIQASSAGTTLRTMYQNLMQPNKKQLEMQKKYNIFTRDTNGRPLEMVDILMQIQKKVPQEKMADAVTQMFRLTSQSGAAALVSHIPDLIDLMLANRNAAGSGITEQIVEEKKNTIQGLWAQVQSTFTEGILQAFEGQEGGWAKQLADLRDYLARPETVDMLKSIVSLVETLAKTLGWFAKIWANLYNMMPGLINGWIKVQLMLTQIGFLITPFRQLYKTMQSLGAVVNGVAASTTTLTFAEQGIARTRQANAATSLIGGAAPVAGAVGGKAANAANYAAYTAQMAYWSGKRATMKNIANLHGGRAMSALKGMPDSTWWAIAAINPSLASAIKSNPAMGLQMYADRYKNSVVATEYAKASRAAKYASFADSKVVAARTQYHEALRAARRPEQLTNRALMARYAAMGGDAALIAQSNAMMAKRDARIAAIATTRHAARGPVAISTAARVARRTSWKNGLGFAATTGIASGMQAGTFKISGIMASLKSAFASVIGYFMKAIGWLLSPLGLVAAAIGVVTASAVSLYKRAKQIKAERVAEVQKANKEMQENQKKTYAPLYNLQEKYLPGFQILSPVSLDNTGGPSSNPVSNAVGDYKTAFVESGKEDEEETQSTWMKTIINSKNSLLSFGARHFGDNEAQQQAKTEKSTRMSHHLDDDWFSYLSSDDANTNELNQDRRAKEALYLAGANNTAVYAAQAQIVKLKKQFLDKKLTEQEFIKQSSELRDKVVNPNAKNLLDANNFTQQQIKNMSWGNFLQYQQGGYNILTAEINGDLGSMSGQIEAMEKLKEGLAMYSDSWWEAIAHLYDGMKYTFNVAGTKITIAMQSLPNGRLDYSSIIEQVKQISQNLSLNLSDFAQMAAQIYEALAKAGAAPGKYYSDYQRFTRQQMEGANVSAADAAWYWDKYIAKGRKNVTFKGMTRQEYIDFVKTNGTGGNHNVIAGRERNQIRRNLADEAAVNAKKQADQITKTANEQKDKANQLSGSTSGTNAGTDKDKNKQKDYQNTYDRSAARPTQVIINIDNLARFDRTAVVKDADDKALIETIEGKIAEAVAMLSAQALNQAGALISQGV